MNRNIIPYYYQKILNKYQQIPSVFEKILEIVNKLLYMTKNIRIQNISDKFGYSAPFLSSKHSYIKYRKRCACYWAPSILFWNDCRTYINYKFEEGSILELFQGGEEQRSFYFKERPAEFLLVKKVSSLKCKRNNTNNKENKNETIKILNINKKNYNLRFNLKNDITNESILYILYSILYNCNYINNIYFNNDSSMENVLYKRIINNLKEEWNDSKWIISFKFDIIFKSEHKKILLNSLNEFIKDNKLILLLNFLLNEDIIAIEGPNSFFNITSNFNLRVSNKLSNLLIDIFFYKLDKKINNLKINFLKKFNNFDYTYKSLNSFNFINNYNNRNIIYNNFLKYNIYIKYLRYYNNFIIGVNGIDSTLYKWQINEIKNEIHLFLKSELLLKNVYSYIVDIHNDNLKFMNIILSNGLDTKNKHKIIFLYPRHLVFKVLIKIGILNKKRKPIEIKRLLKFNINKIISTYININNLILNSFYFCHNYISLFKLISYMIYYSLKLTLQLKLDYKYNTDIIKLLTKLNLIDPKLLKDLYFLKINNKYRNFLNTKYNNNNNNNNNK